MRRGKANTKKSKTENETEGATENEDLTEEQDNEKTNDGEANEDKPKPKRAKKDAASGDVEPAEKRQRRAAKKAEDPPEEEYEVEKVVDMKDIRGKRHYKIHWKGYGPESETWEKEDDLNCPVLINEFLEQLPNKTKKKPVGSKGSKKKAKDDIEDGDTNEEYEVEEVVNMKEKKGKREFLVRWKGFSRSEDTWEPEENLKCPELIEEYLSKSKEKAAAPAKEGKARPNKSKKRVARQK